MTTPKIELFQIIDIENSSYAFRDFVKARRCGGPKPKDYAKTLEFNVDVKDAMDDEVLLGQLWLCLNADGRPYGDRVRSFSMSDIMTITVDSDTRAYYCDTFGFKAVDFNAAQAAVSAALPPVFELSI